MKRLSVLLVMVIVAGAGCFPAPDYDGQPGVCPISSPSAEGGDPCNGTMSCQWGTYGCMLSCTCIYGSWSCDVSHFACFAELPWETAVDIWQYDTADVPPEASVDVNPDCPAEPPFGGASGCGNVRSCEYGSECCCGYCYASTVCQCDGNQWGCYATDACMMPESSCPDVSFDASFDTSMDLAFDTNWDAYDGPDVSYPDVSYPDSLEVYSFDVLVPACCTKNADCGPGFACGSGAEGKGTCKPSLPYGQCWSLEDCPTGSTCLDVNVCPCNADCFVPDQQGTCVTLPSGCCWNDRDCQDGQVCRSQGGIGGLPGSCVDDPAGPACTANASCCWNDNDCPKGFVCGDAVACGCIELCPVCGACAPDRMGTCIAGI
jgi:hypothetical protein